MVAVAIAALSTLFSSAVLAQSNIDVSAVVTGTCKLNAVNALDFGTLDPTTAPAITGKSTTITWFCTKGKTPQTLTIGASATGSFTGSLVNTSVTPNDSFPFGLSWSTTLPSGQGMGTGKEVTLTVNGSIAAGAYANVAGGSYSASVPVVFTP
jgi:spore coat protein U-like protein